MNFSLRKPASTIMFFEGNTATAAHYDSYYLDDEIIGRLLAGLLENIDWNAGRFYLS